MAVAGHNCPQLGFHIGSSEAANLVGLMPDLQERGQECDRHLLQETLARMAEVVNTSGLSLGSLLMEKDVPSLLEKEGEKKGPQRVLPALLISEEHDGYQAASKSEVRLRHACTVQLMPPSHLGPLTQGGQ